jgi:hypothetical protein
MASYTLSCRYNSGSNLYAVVFRADGQVFDWDDDTWQLIGSAVTPGIALTSVVAYGGGQAQYTASVDLETVAPDMTPVDCDIRFFLRAGGSPAPVTDYDLGEPVPLRLIYGEITPETGQDLEVDVTVNLTTTTGVSAHLTVELRRPDGRTLPLADIDPTATCAIEVTQDATATEGERVAQFDLDTTECGSVNSEHQWEIEYANPNFTANRGFKAVATVVSGGVTYQGSCKFAS